MPVAASVPLNVTLSAWVEEAKADPVKYAERRVTEILLHAIGITASLQKSLVLKGGILMSILHGSYRQTGDVDFTAIVDPEPYAEALKELLDRSLLRATAELGVTDLLCAVQRFDYRPKKEGFAALTAPALKLSIGYAVKGTSDARRLEERQSTRILEVDISFKERVINATELVIEDPDVSILAYQYEEIIAEKLRALMQQVIRDRTRRQDIFDIRWLIERYRPDDATNAIILQALRAKAEARCLAVTRDGFDDPTLKERSAREWETMRLEIGERLPDFDESFSIVGEFYRSLPW